MITWGHLLLVFWFGGAVCFAGGLLVGSVVSPDKLRDLGLSTAQYLTSTLLWPVSLVQAFRIGQQDSRWRRKCTPVTREPEPLVIPDPPEPCPGCDAAQRAFQQRCIDLMSEQPRLCPACVKRFEEHGVTVE